MITTIVVIIVGLVVARKLTKPHVAWLISMITLAIPFLIALFNDSFFGFGYLSRLHDPTVFKYGQYMGVIDVKYAGKGGKYSNRGSIEYRRMYLVDLSNGSLFYKKPVKGANIKIMEQKLTKLKNKTAKVDFDTLAPIKYTTYTPSKKEALLPNTYYCPLSIKNDTLILSGNVATSQTFTEGEIVSWFKELDVVIVRSRVHFKDEETGIVTKKKEILTALNRDGKVLWQKKHKELSSSPYATHLRYAFPKDKNLVLLMSHILMSMDPKTGKVLWETNL